MRYIYIALSRQKYLLEPLKPSDKKNLIFCEFKTDIDISTQISKPFQRYKRNPFVQQNVTFNVTIMLSDRM